MLGRVLVFVVIALAVLDERLRACDWLIGSCVGYPDATSRIRTPLLHERP